VAVAHARQTKARHRRWSRRWFRSFLLDPFDVPTYVVFSVVLLVVWPSVITVGILVGGFLLIALMTRKRRRRKAEQAEAANRRLLQGGTRPA
jgi:Flp pilus assembly protein TadB